MKEVLNLTHCRGSSFCWFPGTSLSSFRHMGFFQLCRPLVCLAELIDSVSALRRPSEAEAGDDVASAAILLHATPEAHLGYVHSLVQSFVSSD